MSDAVLIAAIGAVGLIFVALLGLLTQIILKRFAEAKEAAEQTTATLVEVGDKVFRIGEQVDGRLSELLREARALARAEGIAAGEQAQRDRSSEAQT